MYFLFQYFCGLDERCAYFISSYNSVCDMYSQKPYVNCDQIIGPEEPKYDECSSTTTTSSTTTQTTDPPPPPTTTTTLTTALPTTTISTTTPTTTTTPGFHPRKTNSKLLG